MKKITVLLAVLTVIMIVGLMSCGSAPRIVVSEIENKGTSTGIETPEWITTYISSGVSALQAMPLYAKKYCVVGESNGPNKEFVIVWADNFSAQQRIGAMLRTTIESAYQAHETGGSSISADGSDGTLQREIDNVINAVVNVSYSGAQREADWWVLRERHDTINDTYSEEYTAYVLYTIPQQALNEQVASALATSVASDSALYDITIQMAQQIMENGLAEWLDGSADAETPQGTAAL
jgi:hypothetical protein